MDHDFLARLRAIALDLPGVSERVSHGVPCFFANNNRPLCYFHDHHHGDERVTIWCPAPPDVPEEMSAADPNAFFMPPTSSSGVFSGWLGVVLDPLPEGEVDWDEIAAIIEEAFRAVAPRRLVADLDRRS